MAETEKHSFPSSVLVNHPKGIVAKRLIPPDGCVSPGEEYRGWPLDDLILHSNGFLYPICSRTSEDTVFVCNICNISISGMCVLYSHLKGRKHTKALCGGSIVDSNLQARLGSEYEFPYGYENKECPSTCYDTRGEESSFGRNDRKPFGRSDRPSSRASSLNNSLYQRRSPSIHSSSSRSPSRMNSLYQRRSPSFCRSQGTKRERSRSRNGSRSGSSSPEQFRVKQSSHYEKDAIRISSRTLLKPSGSRNRDPHSSFYLESVRFNPDYKNKKYPNDQCTRKSWPKYPQAQPKPISVLFVVQYLFTIKNDLGSLAPLITSILQKAFEAEKAFKGGSNTLLNDISVVNTLDTAKEKLLERITSGTMDKEARKHAKKGIDYILKMYSTILQSRTSENAVAV
ncbi:uncharacterized protein LOC136027414 [Artemia franciscana]|uniref:uncharacterized protein LOC136027414 n=1 Tax=Artemia franciscana TaxID=6661 RepID=UPI0032DA801A